VLEIKEEPGLGLTLNTIIYDGTLKKDDMIVVGGKDKPVITRIRAILVPKPLDEIRDPRDKFSSVQFASAAAGIKIVAPNVEGALAGAPLYAVPAGKNPSTYTKLITEEIGKIRISTDVEGLVLKTDTLGSLEAIADILKQNSIPIRLADVGDISKRDVVEASIVKEHEPLYGAILGFNVRILPDAEEEANARGIQVFREKIIYHVIENYLAWFKGKRDAGLEQDYDTLTKPAKLQILEGYVFRRAKPAIFGVEILSGSIKPKIGLVRQNGEEIGDIQQIQDKGEALSKADKGMQIAVSMDKAVVGRSVFEKDILYVKIPEPQVKILSTTFTDRLSEEEQEALKEYIEVMRKKVPFWGA
jgi:translation initiation factor 5B